MAVVTAPGGPRDESFLNQLAPLHVAHVGRALHTIHKIQDNGFLAQLAPMLALPENTELPSGWIAYGESTVGQLHQIVELSSTWTVPDEPTKKGNQNIFLFNGLQNSGGDFGILQPVLQWGNSGRFGGAFWSVASWYATNGAIAHVSNFIRVNPGEVLTGVISSTGHNDGEIQYSCRFDGHPETNLNISTPTRLNLSFVALEAYQMTDCSEYPGVEETIFTAIKMQMAGTAAMMGWRAVTKISNCGQEAHLDRETSTEAQITLRYRVPPAIV